MALSKATGEVLKDLGHLGLERSVSWAVVQAEMGDGAHAAVTVGAGEGVRRWKLKWDAIWDDVGLIQPQRGNGTEIEPGALQTRTHYLYRFLYRRFTNYDSQGIYFWLWDFFDQRYYAARLEDYSIGYAQVATARQWNSGLSIVEVRMAGSPALPYTGLPATPPAKTPIIDQTASP